MKRLVGTVYGNGTNKIVKVYWSAEYAEYWCRYYFNGVWEDRNDYFTQDKDDALTTANLMVKG